MTKAIRTPENEILEPGYFHPPFPTGQTWLGESYGGHSDYAVDWNRRTKTGDWLEDRGQPVGSAADGTVKEVDKGDGLVMVNHHRGLWRTEYRHMQNIRVKEGDKVRRGDQLGEVGNVAGDGRSFGAHLHHVHYKRTKKGQEFKRIKTRFLGKWIKPSTLSSGQPKTWKPPEEYIVGVPGRATWEDAYKEAAKRLSAAEAKNTLLRAELKVVLDEIGALREGLATLPEAAALAARLSAMLASFPTEGS